MAFRRSISCLNSLSRSSTISNSTTSSSRARASSSSISIIAALPSSSLSFAASAPPDLTAAPGVSARGDALELALLLGQPLLQALDLDRLVVHERRIFEHRLRHLAAVALVVDVALEVGDHPFLALDDIAQLHRHGSLLGQPFTAVGILERSNSSLALLENLASARRTAAAVRAGGADAPRRRVVRSRLPGLVRALRAGCGLYRPLWPGLGGPGGCGHGFRL